MIKNFEKLFRLPFGIILLFIIVAIVGFFARLEAADNTYSTAVYRKVGGAELVVASGGAVTVESGGTISCEAGGTISLPDDALQPGDIGAGALPADVIASSIAVDAVLSGAIKDDEIVNADINSAAAIAISKLATSGTLGSSVIASSIAVDAVLTGAIKDGEIVNLSLIHI